MLFVRDKSVKKVLTDWRITCEFGYGRRTMIDLKRILTATDFSQASQVALQYAGAFAKAFGAEVILCHVLEKPDFLSSLPPVSEAYFPPNLSELQEKHARVQCEQVLAAAGLSQARVLLLHGSPAKEIIRAAAAESVDLIIAGTHGRGAIAHMLLGSVAERIVRTAPCPVLTVRSGEHEFIKD
jgi:universal stress protein A